MEYELLQRITLLVVYLLILVAGLRWGIRNALKERKGRILPLTPRNILWRSGLFAMTVLSGIGVMAVLLGIRYAHPLERAIWVPVYAATLAFIVGAVLFPLVQWFSERFGFGVRAQRGS
jgi:hypothetical protein